jgi:tetratricopeptide (TPR) repeat protein
MTEWNRSLNRITKSIKLSFSFARLLSPCILILCGTGALAHSEANLAYERAEVLAHRNHFKEALPYFDRAIALAPNVAHLHSERAWVLLEMEERERALQDLNKAIRLDPTLRLAIRNRARCHFEMGDIKAAVDDETRSIALGSNSLDKSSDYRDRAAFYIYLKEHGKALADMTTAISIDPHRCWHYYTRGSIYSTLKQYPKAAEDYSRAIKINDKGYGDLSRIYSVRADMYEKMGQKNLADSDRKSARKYAMLDPTFNITGPKEMQK